MCPGRGFYFGDDHKENLISSNPVQSHEFVAIVLEDAKDGYVLVEQRNKFVEGDELEVLSPNDCFNKTLKIVEMKDEKNNAVSVANKVKQKLLIKTDLQLNFSYLTHIFNLPLSFFESRKSGEVLSRLADLDKIKQTLSSAALSGIIDVVMLVVSTPILFSINTKLFGISMITVFFTAVVSAIYVKIYRSYYSKSMSQNADVQSYLYESLNGIATVKAFKAPAGVPVEVYATSLTSKLLNEELIKHGINKKRINIIKRDSYLESTK